MSAALDQWLDGSWRPLTYFSRKFSTVQRVYSAYNRELTAIYFFECEDFSIIMDCKLFIYTFSQRVEKISQRQQYQIAFISQLTTDITYQPDGDNVVADSLSNISDWCKACPNCQQSKISPHNRLLPDQITATDGRFRHVHLDIISLLHR